MSDAPGTLVIAVPCGPAYRANLLAAINWLRPTHTVGPAQEVIDRLVQALETAQYEVAK